MRHRLQREWIKLFDAHDIHIIQAPLFAVFQQVEVNLAGAQHHAADLVILGQFDRPSRHALSIIVIPTLERTVRPKLCQRRLAAGMAQQRFRCHQDERLAEIPLELTAQNVKIIRWRGHIRDLHVVLGTHLQEALKPRG